MLYSAIKFQFKNTNKCCASNQPKLGFLILRPQLTGNWANQRKTH